MPVRFRSFLKDDQGQATTEYILVLLIAISIFLLVYLNFLKPFMKQFGQIIQTKMNTLWFPADFHYFPIHR